MALIFTQTDTDGACAGAVFCGPGTLNAAKSVKAGSSGASAGSTPVSVSIDASATDKYAVWFELTVDSGVSWDSGNWTQRLNVTTANMNLTWTRIEVCRISSGCVNQSTIYNQAQGISLASTGVKDVIGLGVGVTPSVGDKVIVALGFSNGAMTAQSFSFTPDQNIDSPFTAPAPARRQPPVNRSFAVMRASNY